MWPAGHPQSCLDAQVVGEWHSPMISLLKIREGLFILKIKKKKLLCSNSMEDPQACPVSQWLELEWASSDLQSTCGIWALSSRENLERKNSNRLEDSIAFSSMFSVTFSQMLISILNGPRAYLGVCMACSSWYCESKPKGQKDEWPKLLKSGRGTIGSGGDYGKLETACPSDIFTQLQSFVTSTSNFQI